MIASPGWTPAPTTTWSSRSRSPSCAPACARCGTGDTRRARGCPHPDRVPAPRTVPAQPWPGAQPLADLPGGVGLRLRPALEQPLGVRELPAHQARGCRRATHPAHRTRARLRPARCAVTLRNRVSVAAAVGVLIVVAVVSTVLYFFYAASLHSRVDAALVDAAQQASSIAQRIKESGAGDSRPAPDINEPVTVGSVEVQLIPGPVAVGQPT